MFCDLYTAADIKAAKKVKFDSTLWLSDRPKLRVEFAYKETPNWKDDPRNGVITYPVCPFCGTGDPAHGNKEFVRGRLCEGACELAWDLHYWPKETGERIRAAVTRRRTEAAINYSI